MNLEHKIRLPPQANWKISFGEISHVYSMYFQFYIEKPPNRFQRWMMKKVLGICWTPIE